MTDLDLKKEFVDGPWQEENDRDDWVDNFTGLKCALRRVSQVGHLCGYVEVKEDHKFRDQDSFCIDINVHGGITYGNTLNSGDETYFIGFDCGHAGDYIPAKKADKYKHLTYTTPDSYRTEEYVREQIKQLAKQVHEVYYYISNLRSVFCTCKHLARDEKKQNPKVHLNCPVTFYGGMREAPVRFDNYPWREKKDQREDFTLPAYVCKDIEIPFHCIVRPEICSPAQCDLILSSFYFSSVNKD